MDIYTSVVNNAVDAILIVDSSNFKICYANLKAQELYKFSLRELKRKTIADLSLDSFLTLRNSDMFSITNFDNEIKIQKKKNSECFEAEISCRNIEIKNKKYIAMFIKDITSKIMQEEEFWIGPHLRLPFIRCLQQFFYTLKGSSFQEKNEAQFHYSR